MHQGTGPIGAIIFVLAEHLVGDSARCIAYCKARGYQVVGVITDDWQQAIEYIYKNIAQVMVIADYAHIPADRTPRVEAVTLQADAGEPGHERSRMVRRNDAWRPTRPAVRRLLDDDGATVPLGIDPATIAAARRIARFFDGHSNCR